MCAICYWERTKPDIGGVLSENVDGHAEANVISDGAEDVHVFDIDKYACTPWNVSTHSGRKDRFQPGKCNGREPLVEFVCPGEGIAEPKSEEFDIHPCESDERYESGACVVH